MPVAGDRVFSTALLVYAAATLAHFAHNAEFRPDYPNPPATWSRADVYLAWAGMTLVGLIGWISVACGYRKAGLLLIAAYALLGLDSLAHYVVAPFTAHSAAMNATIVFEVTMAFLVVLAAAMRLYRCIVATGVRRNRPDAERNH